MSERIKTLLASEKTMRAVNLLFLLSMLIPGLGIIYLAYLFWIAYLVYFIRRTASKTIKIWNSLLIVLASCMIAVNLYFMLHSA